MAWCKLFKNSVSGDESCCKECNHLLEEKPAEDQYIESKDGHICPDCKQKWPIDYYYCPKCGTELEEA